MSILHLTSIAGPITLPFVSSGNILILVQACDFCHFCTLYCSCLVCLFHRWTGLQDCGWLLWSHTTTHCQGCHLLSQICNSIQSSALRKWMASLLDRGGLEPVHSLTFAFLCSSVPVKLGKCLKRIYMYGQYGLFFTLVRKFILSRALFNFVTFATEFKRFGGYKFYFDGYS